MTDTISDLLNDLSKTINILTNKYRFMNEVIDEIVIIYKTPKQTIIQQLDERKYDKMNDSYHYLLQLPIYHFSEEKLNEIKKDIDRSTQEYETLQELSIQSYWKKELKELKLKLK